MNYSISLFTWFLEENSGNNWEKYCQGWLELLESLDIVLWNVLLATAFLVRGLALIMLLYGLAERIWLWDERHGTKRIILSSFVLIIVTIPFILSNIPLIYPSW